MATMNFQAKVVFSDDGITAKAEYYTKVIPITVNDSGLTTIPKIRYAFPQPAGNSRYINVYWILTPPPNSTLALDLDIYLDTAVDRTEALII